MGGCVREAEAGAVTLSATDRLMIGSLMRGDLAALACDLADELVAELANSPRAWPASARVLLGRATELAGWRWREERGMVQAGEWSRVRDQLLGELVELMARLDAAGLRYRRPRPGATVEQMTRTRARWWARLYSARNEARS